MYIRTVIASTIDIVGDNFVKMLSIAIPTGLLNLIIISFLRGGHIPRFLGIGTSVVASLVTVFTIGSLVCLAYDGYQGKDANLTEAAVNTFRKLPALLVASFVGLIMILLTMSLFLIPGIWLFIQLLLFVPVIWMSLQLFGVWPSILNEDKNALSAITASFKAGSGSRIKTLFSCFFLLVVLLGTGLALHTLTTLLSIFSFLPGLKVLSIFIKLFISSIVAAFSATYITVLYQETKV